MSTRYGCCGDGVTGSNADGSNCPIGGCAGTQHGCCPGSTVAQMNPSGTNCLLRQELITLIIFKGPEALVWIKANAPAGIIPYLNMNRMCTTPEACCEMWMTNLGIDTHYCPGNPPTPALPADSTWASQIYADSQTKLLAAAATLLAELEAAGVLPPLIGGCISTMYGCCLDTSIASNADGSNCPGYVAPTPS